MVATRAIRERAEAVQGLVRAFANAARVRISDEPLVEKRVQDAADRVVEESVAHRGLVDASRLGIGDVERVIPAVAIGVVDKVFAQCENVIHEPQREPLHVPLCLFPACEFAPGLK